MIGAVVALIANSNEDGGANVGIADNALSLALIAEATDGDAPLFAAHDEIGVMLGHSLIFIFN